MERERLIERDRDVQPEFALADCLYYYTIIVAQPAKRSSIRSVRNDRAAKQQSMYSGKPGHRPTRERDTCPELNARGDSGAKHDEVKTCRSWPSNPSQAL